MTCLMLSVFFIFIGYIPLGKAFSLRRWGVLFRTARSLKLICDEAINEISSADFCWYLRAVFTHVVLWIFWALGTLHTLCWICSWTCLLKISLFCFIAQSIYDNILNVHNLIYPIFVELFNSPKSLSQGRKECPLTRKYWKILLNLPLLGNVGKNLITVRILFLPGKL
jgi:hypothetical protein